MRAGNRVKAKADVPDYGGQRGSLVERDNREVPGWKVLLDGRTGYTPFAEHELLPLEVVVLDGTLQYYSGIVHPEGYYVSEKPLSEVFDRLDESEVRITIERVKKEAPTR